jgi:hypothetical protein
MKISKKLLLLTATPIVALGITGAVFALNTDAPKPAPKTKLAASVKAQEDAPAQTTETTPVQSATTQTTTETPPVQTVDPVQALKDDIAAKVRAKASKDGVANIELQVYCVDKMISENGGYTAANIDSLTAGYFNIANAEHPNAYSYYDSPCHMVFAGL